jgi:hypothetical protein
MWDRSYRAHFSHAAETSNNAPSVSRTERRVIRRPRHGAKRRGFPAGLRYTFQAASWEEALLAKRPA